MPRTRRKKASRVSPAAAASARRDTRREAKSLWSEARSPMRREGPGARELRGGARADVDDAAQPEHPTGGGGPRGRRARLRRDAAPPARSANYEDLGRQIPNRLPSGSTRCANSIGPLSVSGTATVAPSSCAWSIEACTSSTWT